MRRLSLILLLLAVTSSFARAETRYGIQVAAFSEFSRAEEVQMALEEAGYISYFSEIAGYKRVRVGPFRRRAEAEAEAEALWSFVVARFGPQEFQKPWVIIEDRVLQNAPVRDAALAPPLVPPPPRAAPANATFVLGDDRWPDPAAVDTRARALIERGFSYLGTPYVWGGEGEEGFDCSGFTQFLFAGAGYELPRQARNQFKVGEEIAADDLLPGDLVFFSTYSSGASHVGIYIGDGQFLHASSGPDQVTVSSLAQRYYTNRYLGARRVFSQDPRTIAEMSALVNR